MAVAFLSAQRSKDPNKQVLTQCYCMRSYQHLVVRTHGAEVRCADGQVGACIVSKERVILGIGYNGFPRGCPDTELPWAKQSMSGNPLDTKYPYVCHAELNAILNKNTASLEGAVSIMHASCAVACMPVT